MFALLLAAAAIYLVLGDFTEAIVLAVFASTSVLIAVVQEARTERVLESLRDLTSLRALVIRDGAEKRIAGTTPSRHAVAFANDLEVAAHHVATISTPMSRCSPVRLRPCEKLLLKR